MNHFIACAWYGVGQLSPDGWTKQLDGESLTYKYLTSVHWSVAQFQSSMDIHAQNEAERIYSIIVVLIALVLFSSFLSSITNSTAQLQRHRREYTNRQRVIREYLKEHNVSPEMSVRVKKQLAHGGAIDARQKHEEQHKILAALPQHLLVDLYEEARVPILVSHAFFGEFHSEYPRAMRRLCYDAMVSLPAQNQEVVFQMGDPCKQMFFVEQGTFSYRLGRALSQSPLDMSFRSQNSVFLPKGEIEHNVTAGRWLSEAAMWTKWEHCGSLSNEEAGFLLALQVDSFLHAVRQHEDAFIDTVLYAREFVKELNDGGNVSDLHVTPDVVRLTQKMNRVSMKSRLSSVSGKGRFSIRTSTRSSVTTATSAMLSSNSEMWKRRHELTKTQRPEVFAKQSDSPVQNRK